MVESKPDPAVFDAILELGQKSQSVSRPNPWVGAAVVSDHGVVSLGATEGPGERHAEVVALDLAGDRANGATMYVTLEPCAHFGKTPPCAERIAKEGVREVVVGTLDPDPKVSGKGVSYLINAGISVKVISDDYRVVHGLRQYVKQRSVGEPWVVLKLAITIDGKVAAKDGSSKWITGPKARHDVHKLRANSDVIVVGANTVRVDDPSLTARDVDGVALTRQPKRVVLGTIPADAKVLPAESYMGSFKDLLLRLGQEEALQVLVEGGPKVAYDLHARGLLDEYVFYIAPMLGLGGSRDAFDGGVALSIDGFWRSSFETVDRLDADLRVSLLSVGARDLLDNHISWSRRLAQELGAEIV